MSSKKILIVDDETQMREVAAMILSDNGYEVLQAEGGKKAIEQTRTLLPDLILCDVRMPDMDGFQVIEALKETPATACIPFIFLTGFVDKETLRKGMQQGADDYLTKPFTSEELLRAVTVRLEKRSVIRKMEEQKMEELRENISLSFPHELRTPLTGILGFSEVLITNNADLSREEVAEIGTRIQKSARRLNRWLENFLLMTEVNLWRRDEQKRAILRSLQTPSWGLVVDQVVRDCAERARREGDLHLQVGNFAAAMKEEHARKVVSELAENAFKFSHRGTPVTVSISANENFVFTTIEDRGRGMPAEDIQRIGVFVQFDRKRDEQQGAGLGLALAKSLVELYGGSFVIQSAVNVGTRITISIPLT